MNNLFKILEEPNDKLIALDLDGTLCKGEFWGEGEPEPLRDRIEYFNSLYKKGAHIIIYTARHPRHFEKTQNWLDKYGVMYHGIAMMKKIGADVYIDDKAININDIKIWKTY